MSSRVRPFADIPQFADDFQVKARVGLKSELDPLEVERAHLEPVADVAARLGDELARRGRDVPIAVLPEGPMTIPYLASGTGAG